MKNVHRALLTALLAAAAVPGLAEPVKIISAIRAAAPPVIDGVLDDACWKTVEVREDLVSVTQSRPGRTVVRLAYDAGHLYVAVEVFGRDATELDRGIAEFRQRPGLKTGWLPSYSSGFANLYSIELFLDPGRSLRNHYQFLFNAADQACGHYRGQWNFPFAPVPASACRVDDGCWREEFVFPLQTANGTELKPGDEWGINLARNDATQAAIWRPIDGDWNNPKEFGLLLIGSYSEWWDARWTHGAAAEFDQSAEAVQRLGAKCRYLPDLYRLAREKAARVDSLAKRNPPVDSAAFQALDSAYADYCRYSDRLTGLIHTLETDGK